MFMLFFVLDNPDDSQAVLSGWNEAGASGVTILRSTGLGRVYRHATFRDDLPLFPGLDDLFHQDETQNRTLITVVDDRNTVDKIIEATVKITGDLDLPNTGVLFVLPVLEAYGLNRKNGLS